MEEHEEPRDEQGIEEPQDAERDLEPKDEDAEDVKGGLSSLKFKEG